MELDFDSDQEALRDSVRAFLAAECPISSVRAIVETRIGGDEAEPTELHRKMCGLGWPALTVPGGVSSRGMPTGVELLGRPGRESLLFALGAVIERSVGPRPIPELS